MVRGLIAGAVGFAVAFAAERAIVGMTQDIARYDRMRKMSGEESLAKELFSTVASLITGSVQKNGITSFVNALTSDAVRYAKMRGM